MLSWAEALRLSGRPRPAAPIQPAPHAAHAGAGQRLPNGNGCGCGGVTPDGTPNGCSGNSCTRSAGSGIDCQGTIVQGNAMARPSAAKLLKWEQIDCRPDVYITCPTHEFFEINPDNRLVFFWDPATCEFETNASPGGCPTSYAQMYGIQNEDGSYGKYVDLPDGTYRITVGAANPDPPVFTRVDCPPAACKRYWAKWENIQGNDSPVITGPLILEELDVSLNICAPQT